MTASGTASAGDATATPRRGTITAPPPPAARAASSATRPRPSPESTASTISRCTERRRSTSRPPARGEPGSGAGTGEEEVNGSGGEEVVREGEGTSRGGGSPGVAAPPCTLLGRRGRGVRMGLQGLHAGLPGADPEGLLDGHHEHLAVADRAGAGVLEDHVDDRRHVLRLHHALDLDLRPEVVRQLRPAIAL